MAVDPSTGHEFAELPSTSPELVGEMVEDAHRALAVEHEWRTPLVRAKALTRLARRIEAEERVLTELETRDTGKPLKQAKADVAATARYLDYYAGLDRAPRGPPDPARPRRPRLHGARAVGRVRADHPLELPAAGHRPLRRARAGGRATR